MYGFAIIGMVEDDAEVKQITNIVKVAKVANRMQNLPKGVLNG